MYISWMSNAPAMPSNLSKFDGYGFSQRKAVQMPREKCLRALFSYSVLTKYDIAIRTTSSLQILELMFFCCLSVEM